MNYFPPSLFLPPPNSVCVSLPPWFVLFIYWLDYLSLFKNENPSFNHLDVKPFATPMSEYVQFSIWYHHKISILVPRIIYCAFEEIQIFYSSFLSHFPLFFPLILLIIHRDGSTSHLLFHLYIAFHRSILNLIYFLSVLICARFLGLFHIFYRNS